MSLAQLSFVSIIPRNVSELVNACYFSPSDTVRCGSWQFPWPGLIFNTFIHFVGGCQPYVQPSTSDYLSDFDRCVRSRKFLITYLSTVVREKNRGCRFTSAALNLMILGSVFESGFYVLLRNIPCELKNTRYIGGWSWTTVGQQMIMEGDVIYFIL